MRLTYYVAIPTDTATQGPIRTRTKKDCAALRLERGEANYEEAQRVDMDYKDGFDLMTRCLERFNFEPTKGPEKKSRPRKTKDESLNGDSTEATSEDEIETATRLPETDDSATSLEA